MYTEIEAILNKEKVSPDIYRMQVGFGRFIGFPAAHIDESYSLANPGTFVPKY